MGVAVKYSLHKHEDLTHSLETPQKPGMVEIPVLGIEDRQIFGAL